MAFAFRPLILAALLLAPSLAAAATVNLVPDLGTGNPDDPRCRGGFACISYRAGDFAYTTSTSYNASGGIYLHDDGGARRTEVWRPDGLRFDATELTFSFGAAWYRTGSTPFIWPDPDFPDPFDPDFLAWAMSGDRPTDEYFWIRGYREGAVVAELGFGDLDPRTATFGDAFRNLDHLEFELSDLGAESYYFFSEDTPPNLLWCMDYCVGARVSSLTYELSPIPAPVPLPASGLALAGVLLGLGLTAAQKTRNARRRPTTGC